MKVIFTEEFISSSSDVHLPVPAPLILASTSISSETVVPEHPFFDRLGSLSRSPSVPQVTTSSSPPLDDASAAPPDPSREEIKLTPFQQKWIEYFKTASFQDLESRCADFFKAISSSSEKCSTSRAKNRCH
ncbi:hypothetical protein TNIN_377841 [Trichonephila inaurata madagascariensis]|uniref:Uncharacterized protein n=1 Tax=Trichonephila inaurata madagascariensis TaxID=2747483 RepID=A0A8X6XT20_9ARAC|nr:hypothetical protein TNIN_377841 [Trichonephila inaurata madagascariensis]